MTKHLSDEEFCRTLTGDAGDGIQDHLDHCSYCRDDRTKLEAGIKHYRQWVDSESERSNAFWIQQRNSIASKVDRRNSPRLPLAWALASIACVVIVAAALMIEREPQMPEVVMDPDHELLLDIERSLRRDVPKALAPAELLVEEIRLAVAANSDKRRGEPQ